VQIQWLQVVDYRNYRTLSHTPAPSLNVLSGSNGQGKSNLLEALSVLLVGRSFRGARAADMVCWGADGARVGGEIRRGPATHTIRRELRRREDGSFSVTGEGCGWARVVPFAWQDVAILNGPPLTRRNFIDGFAAKLAPAHIGVHARYRQILERRNHLLQSAVGWRDLAERLGPWDAQLAAVGLDLVARRRAAVATLGAELEPLHAALGGRGRVRLEYCSSFGDTPTLETIHAALIQRRGEEVRRGQTSIGPHRDDLLIGLEGRDARVYGSRGQQRLLALAMRLSEVGPVAAVVGSPPVLLLDDALSELDPDVQRRVLERVDGQGQVFLTTAEAGLSARAAAWWHVGGGTVEPAAAPAPAVSADDPLAREAVPA
jgi:DNA replication and repair protein RecF